MTNPPGSFIWYELMTTDANAATSFYGSVLGWKIPRAAAQPPGGLDYRMITCGDGGQAGGLLQLTQDMCTHGAHAMWLGYLMVKDVDSACRAITADGGKVLTPKMALPVGEIAMVADPMGTPFYVMTPLPPPGQPDAASHVFDRKGLQRVRWNELASPDLARAKAFYAKHFNFEFNEVLSMGALGDYCFIAHGDMPRIGAITEQSSGSSHATWLFYFGVKSVLAAKRAVEQGGGKLLYDPMEVPGGEWVFAAADPEGVAFGIAGKKGE